jgi:hypothetical protein
MTPLRIVVLAAFIAVLVYFVFYYGENVEIKSN